VESETPDRWPGVPSRAVCGAQTRDGSGLGEPVRQNQVVAPSITCRFSPPWSAGVNVARRRGITACYGSELASPRNRSRQRRNQMLRTPPRLVPALALLMAGVLLAPSSSAQGGPERAARPLRSIIAPDRLDRLHRNATDDAPRTAAQTQLGALIAPTVTDSFDGIANLFPFASPSDATGAVGPDFFVAGVNVHVQVFDRTGASVLAASRLNDLFSDLPNGTDTDPKVIYDPYDDHFVLAYLLYNNSEGYIVVVSIPAATADQKSTWCHWTYVGDQISGDGHQFADYPGLGFTANRVTITTNNFPFSGPGYDYVQILSFKKSQLYDPACAGTPNPKVLGGNKTDVPDGSPAFTIQPAETAGGVDPKVQYMASFDFNGTRKEEVVLWRLKFVNGKAKLAKTAMPVGQVNIPPFGTQCDGTADIDTKWDPGDTRMINAYYDVDAGMLYTAHAVAHQFGSGATESAARWYEVKPKATIDNSFVNRKAFVGREDYDVGWPSVATDAGGVLFVNYSEASDAFDECLSIYAATVQPGDTAAASTQVFAGVSLYDAFPGPERWGDYSAINRDPADLTGATMAIFNAYGLTTARWQHLVATVAA
jgi:hypothetical protein